MAGKIHGRRPGLSLLAELSRLHCRLAPLRAATAHSRHPEQQPSKARPAPSSPVPLPPLRDRSGNAAREMQGHSRRRRLQGVDDHGLHPSAVADPHLTTETGSSRRQGAPRILSDSLFGGDKLCSSRRVGSIPMKMVMDGEVSGEARHASLGIVGRLMGLDMMPSFGVQIMSPRSSCDKYGFSGDFPHRRSTDEITEFKDVFEVMEAARMKTESLSSGHTNVCSGLDKVNNADMNFVRQKFMDAKRISTEESFQRSKEFNGALEALVSNKDLLLEFIQESNHVPMKACADVSCSPFSAVNRITVLKPSRRNKFVDSDLIYPPVDTKWCCHAPTELKHSQRKPCANHSTQTPKEDTGSFRQKSSRSSLETHASPTRIVVLKPCLEKTENMEGAFPLTKKMFQSSYRKPKGPTCSPHIEEYMYQVSTGKCDALGRGGKGSTEIAHEVTEETRRAVKGVIGGNRIFNPDIGPFSWDAQTSLLSSMAKLNRSEAYQRSNGCDDAWDAPDSGYFPTYSTKVSVRKEAKRRLSARWKMTRQYLHPSQDANSFRTLGDMLALSDKEISEFTSGSSTCRKCPKGELNRDGIPGSCGYPLGISSNDGWKDESLWNSTRLKSFSSSISQKSLNMSSRKENSRLGEFFVLKDIVTVAPNNSEDELVHGRLMRSLIASSAHHCDKSDTPSLDGDESMITEHEIHMNFEGPACCVAVHDSSEERRVQPEDSDHILSAQGYLDSSYMAQASVAGNLVEPVWVLDDLVSLNPLDSANQAEEHVLDQCGGNAFTSNAPEESVSHMNSREDDQPSPVSVLESSLDTEDGCLGGFEKISADLQELRIQLRFLKMEATDNTDESKLTLSSDDGTPGSCKPLNEAGQMCDAFWDADDRDFSYVLDMLTCLGIHSDEQDFLVNACYLWEYPTASDIYDSLEKKYRKLVLWPQAERRLLFDLTNGALMSVVVSLTRCGRQGMLKKWQSKWDKEGVLDEVWGRVCRQRQEAESLQEERLMGVGWLDCEDVIYQIAQEVGSILGEDLLKEVIADLLL